MPPPDPTDRPTDWNLVMDNDRTVWILVAFMVITFAFFAAGIFALAFWDFT